MSTNKSVAVVEAAFQAFAEGGPRALLARYDEFFDECFEFRPALVGGLDGRSYRGREEFEQYWRDFTDAFEEIDFGRPQIELVGPGRVLVVANLHVRGAGGGVPIEQEAGFLWDVCDGLITAGRTFFSRAEALEFAHA